jgi:hypothetical protein
MLTERQLKLHYWFITHKPQLKIVLIISLIVLNMGLWGYSIYGLVVYFNTAKGQEAMLENLTQELIDWPAHHLKNKPQNLIPYEITVIPLGKGIYDLTLLIENPNSKWTVVSLDYRFVWLDGESKWQKSFLLPLEKKSLFGLKIPSGEPIRNPQIEFRNIRWKRVSPRRKLPQIDKSDFIIENIRFIRGSKILPSRVTFEATNKTNYNFWQVDFKIILYQGEKIVGLNFISTQQFFSNEKRSLEVFWSEILPSITRVYIEPEVNILDPENFMKFS